MVTWSGSVDMEWPTGL